MESHGIWIAQKSTNTVKCIWRKINFSIFWKFSIIKTLFELYNAWKLCDFSLKNGFPITQSKCLVWWPDDVLLWTRLRNCNTMQHVLAVHNINIYVVVWTFKESTQFRLAGHVVLPRKPFLVINSVHNTMSQVKLYNKFVPVSWPFFWQKLSSFQWHFTLTFTINLFTYWTVKFCKKTFCFICTLSEKHCQN